MSDGAAFVRVKMVGVKMESRQLRAVRGSAAAWFATFVALASHVIAGGAWPTIMGLIVPLALSGLVCVLLAGRRLSLWRLSVSVFVSQSLFHLLFTFFTPTAHTTSAPVAVNALERYSLHHGGAHGSGHGLMPGAMTDSMATGQAMHSHASLSMIFAHVVAGFITIAMIYWAEQLPVSLCEFARVVIRALVPKILGAHTVPEGPRQTIILHRVIPRNLGVLRSPVLRRGPPLAAF